MNKNLNKDYEATLNEEIIEETQRQKSILELLLSKDEAGYYLRNAEDQKKSKEHCPVIENHWETFGNMLKHM